MSRTRDSEIQSETEPAVSSSKARNASDFSRDQIFEILSNQRRRWVLHFLKQQDGGVTEIRELSTQIAAWENEKPPDLITSSERKRIYTSLHQFHLPKMSENKIVKYDQQGGAVELSAQATDLEVYLDVVREDTVPWSLYYAGISVVIGLILGAVWFDLPPFDLLPSLVWTTGCIVVFFLSALTHYYYERQLRLGRDGNPPILTE